MEKPKEDPSKGGAGNEYLVTVNKVAKKNIEVVDAFESSGVTQKAIRIAKLLGGK
jgi:hypothetical protein